MKTVVRHVLVVLIVNLIGCGYDVRPDERDRETAAADVEWLTGSSNPELAQGVDGDLYMNTATGDVFVRTSGSWILAGNVTGPAGAERPERTRMSEMLDHVVLAADVIPYWQSAQARRALRNDRSAEDGYSVRDALALSRVLQAVSTTRESSPQSAGPPHADPP